MNFISPNKIVNRIFAKINRYRYSFLAIPGMMGYDERMNLFNTCRNEISGKGVAVEFGSFFGASSAAIQHGLKENKTFSGSIEFHVVDCFKCSLTSEFSKITRELARRGQIEHLLNKEGDWLNFYEAFLSHINSSDPSLIIHKSFLSDFIWKSQPVEFLHLDLPKDWLQASYIASIIFPDLVVGGKVLFQDFGYQWSAELIAMIGILIDMKLIQPYRVTDTTLSVNVEKRISNENIDILKNMMNSPREVLLGIESAMKACENLAIPSIDTTLLMAKAQYLYAQNDVMGCFKIISSLLENNLDESVSRGRLAELFSRSFVIDKSYEKSSEIDYFHMEE